MNRMTLQEYLAIPGNTQTGLAKAVGVTQGAVNQMVNSGRTIYVIDHGTKVELEEIRRLGRETAA